jgi:hypothetical protein
VVLDRLSGLLWPVPPLGRPPRVFIRLGDKEGVLSLCCTAGASGSLGCESGAGAGGGFLRDEGDPREGRWESFLSRSHVSMTGLCLLAAVGTPGVGPPGPNTEDTVREADDARTTMGGAAASLSASVRPHRPTTWHWSMKV